MCCPTFWVSRRLGFLRNGTKRRILLANNGRTDHHKWTGRCSDLSSERVSGTSLSGPVKAVLIFQSLVVAALCYWLVKEYENNIFLREYVQKATWTYLPVMAFVATFSVAVGVSEAFAHVRKTEENLVAPPLGVVGPSRSGPLLTGGFESSAGGSQQVLAVVSTSGGSRAASDVSALSSSLASVFSEWRPPGKLKRVESTVGQDDPYGPTPFPVIRRLRPAVEPEEEETPKVTPRPLNRISLANANLVPLPPILRQIGSNVEEETWDESDEEESPRQVKLRTVKKKRAATGQVTSDMTNDLE
jgi:hypothetical protein